MHSVSLLSTLIIGAVCAFTLPLSASATEAPAGASAQAPASSSAAQPAQAPASSSAAQPAQAPASSSAAQPTQAPGGMVEEPKLKMRTYYMGFLRRGPKWSAKRTPEAIAIGEGHMAHIRKMGESGKLVLAGPFILGADARKNAIAGIFIFDVATIEEARALTAADPAVKAKRFTMEVVPWLGPEGLTYTGDVRKANAAAPVAP